MSKMHIHKAHTVYLTEIPKCNFCDKPAAYDAKTIMGPWAYLCERHFQTHARGSLGLGRGQKLEKRA